MFRTILTIFFLIFFFTKVNSQSYTKELGVFLGYSSIQTDYGERRDLQSNLANSNINIGVSYYISFINKNYRWNPSENFLNRVILRTDLNYTFEKKLEHFGKWIEKDSPTSDILKAMSGSVSMLNFGFNLEYYLFNLEDYFYSYKSIINPFISLGIKYTFYSNNLTSTLGNWEENISVLPPKYQTFGAIDIGSGSALSIVPGIGARLKLTEQLDFSTLLSFQYFFSDAIDGLQANVPENKNNDWLVNIQFGFIYHLNF